MRSLWGFVSTSDTATAGAKCLHHPFAQAVQMSLLAVGFFACCPFLPARCRCRCCACGCSSR